MSLLSDLRILYRFEKLYGLACLHLAHFIVLTLKVLEILLVMPILRVLEHLSKRRLLVEAAQEYWQGTHMAYHECLGKDGINSG